MIQIISWNLNHRTLEKKIPSNTLEYFRECNADIILLNEYIDRGGRESFLRELKEIGYVYQEVSPQISNHNQVFAASRIPFNIGDLVAPQFDGSAKTNFLHIQFPSEEIELVGFRAPAYVKKADRDLYWSQLRSVMELASDRAICFIGDANYEPFRGASTTSKEVVFDVGGSYTIPNPKGDWSYISLNGKSRSRIDHAFLSQQLDYENPQYLASFNDIVLAGAKDDLPITDHAVLSLTIHKKMQNKSQ